MGAMSGSPEPVMVVSSSPRLRHRIRDALSPMGQSCEEAAGATSLARHRRQRPFLACFVDARQPNQLDALDGCFRSRPSERFVLILGCWQPEGAAAVPNGFKAFGFLREPFGRGEVQAWALRAAEENRFLQGDRSLEELLHERFRAFLRDLGPQAATSLHDVILGMTERPLIRAVLEWTGGNQSRAAEVLGIHRNTLRAKVRALGIDLSEFRPA